MSNQETIISLQSYAAVIAGLGAGLRLRRALLHAEVAASAWDAGAEHWQSQIDESAASDLAVLVAFDGALVAARRRFEPTIEPIESDPGAWAQFRRHFVTAVEPVAFLSERGLSLGTYARIEAAWANRLLADEALAEAIQRHMDAPLSECPALTMTPSPWLLEDEEAPPLAATPPREAAVEVPPPPPPLPPPPLPPAPLPVFPPAARPISAPPVVQPSYRMDQPSYRMAPPVPPVGVGRVNPAEELGRTRMAPDPSLTAAMRAFLSTGPAAALPFVAPGASAPQAAPGWTGPVPPISPAPRDAAPRSPQQPEAVDDPFSGPTLQIVSPLRAALPFQRNQPPGRAFERAPELTLEQYASLCVELDARPDRVVETLARYHLSGEGRASLDALWKPRLSADPALHVAFVRAYATYKASFAQASGAGSGGGR
jgi:hypothetical protein